jgi:hypothetical protein
VLRRTELGHESVHRVTAVDEKTAGAQLVSRYGCQPMRSYGRLVGREVLDQLYRVHHEIISAGAKFKRGEGTKADEQHFNRLVRDFDAYASIRCAQDNPVADPDHVALIVAESRHRFAECALGLAS